MYVYIYIYIYIYIYLHKSCLCLRVVEAEVSQCRGHLPLHVIKCNAMKVITES